jgi:hypothetical protein
VFDDVHATATFRRALSAAKRRAWRNDDAERAMP